ncbi:class A beta-lactamase [Isoptericola sp. 178]|uniref:class A beta-lactamase n=1 Tax=Isoptericola sp. 178 TaxID=3064651 RepID=UPI002712C462|nr:class A beta-lactamase [Isoptericola sp. 178]MDO8145713.1 class A beta-lactamase [Isoptericola sp. 178]
MRDRATSRTTARRYLPAVLVLLLGAGCGAVEDGPDDGSSAAVAEEPPAAVASREATEPPDSAGPGDEVPTDPQVARALEELEAQFDARLGVVAVDTGSGKQVEYRADERFAYASTIKAPLAGVVLATTDDTELDQVVTFTEADLVAYSPVTQDRVATGMTRRELAEAAVRYSDNTAANLLLRDVGGPAGLRSALQAVGDDVTRPARDEPSLNEAVPGDVRDTTTPRAMAATLRAFAVGAALDTDDRDLFNDWLLGNTTGDDLIRAGTPAGWAVGDKTGTGGFGTRNDIAVVTPPGRAPVVLAVFSDKGQPDADPDDRLVAAAARQVLEAFE